MSISFLLIFILLVIARNEAISLTLNLLLKVQGIASSFLLARTFVFVCHTEPVEVLFILLPMLIKASTSSAWQLLFSFCSRVTGVLATYPRIVVNILLSNYHYILFLQVSQY
jgi:hypothetical protein